jgi:hypothetical protein
VVLVKRWDLLLMAFVLVGASCADAPFEAVNPNHQRWQGTMRIVSSHDTVSTAVPRFTLQLVTDPVVFGYEPIWEVSSRVVEHLGNGVFRVVGPVNNPTTVLVTARFAARAAAIIIPVRADPVP